MSEKSIIILRVLLNRFHGGAAESLLRSLPEDDSRKVQDLPIESTDISPILGHPIDTYKHIHYSWLIPHLQGMDKSMLPFTLSFLPEEHTDKLRNALNETSQPLRLSNPMKTFLKSRMTGELKFEGILPLQYLPVTELSPLTHLSKNELIEIIDFLGIYDLAEEVHQIVDKTILEKIYNCMTQKKQAFLRSCLHQKEKLVTQRLQLESWDGDCKKLSKLLHHRGMVRLGYALSGQHPDLNWHITRILDTGRGAKLESYITKEPIPGVTETLKKQVVKLLKFFKQGAKK